MWEKVSFTITRRDSFSTEDHHSRARELFVIALAKAQPREFRERRWRQYSHRVFIITKHGIARVRIRKLRRYSPRYSRCSRKTGNISPVETTHRAHIQVDARTIRKSERKLKAKISQPIKNNYLKKEQKLLQLRKKINSTVKSDKLFERSRGKKINKKCNKIKNQLKCRFVG